MWAHTSSSLLMFVVIQKLYPKTLHSFWLDNNQIYTVCWEIWFWTHLKQFSLISTESSLCPLRLWETVLNKCLYKLLRIYKFKETNKSHQFIWASFLFLSPPSDPLAQQSLYLTMINHLSVGCPFLFFILPGRAHSRSFISDLGSNSGPPVSSVFPLLCTLMK